MIYLLGGIVNGENVLFLDKQNSFQGSENLENAKKLLPDLNQYHVAGYQWSMSASIWWLQYQPRLVEVKDMDELEKALSEDKKAYINSSISGSARYAKLKKDYTVKVIEECKLMDERMNTAKPFYKQ